jgi:hypothetical protein
MKVVKEVTLALVNRPGSLAKLSAGLAAAKVNIQAISVVESTDVSVVRVVTDKPAEAQKVAKALGAAASTKEVLALSLSNRPGALGKACEKLGRKKVNIDYVYGSATGGGKSTIILAAGPARRAQKALGRGF